MIAGVRLNDKNELELYVIPDGDTDTAMLKMYGVALGLQSSFASDFSWRSERTHKAQFCSTYENAVTYVAPKRDPRVGDVVRLNSGGPEMIVEVVDGDRVLCAWLTLPVAAGDPVTISRNAFLMPCVKLVRAAP